MFALLPQKRVFVEHLQSLNTNENTQVRLFVDLRNAITIFHDEAQAQMQLTDPAMLISEVIKDILHFIDYMYAIIPFKLEFNFFWEVGRSEYHRKINKNYKSKRGNSYLILSPNDVSKLKDINIAAFLIWEELAKNIHNVKCYKLNYFEADFIPHYIINKLDEDNEDSLYHKNINAINYIFSTDKDLGQTINNPNTFQVKKVWGTVPEYNVDGKRIGDKRGRITTIVNYNDINNDLLKDFNLKFPEKSNYIVDLLTLVGDDADEISGIKGVSYKKAYELLEIMDFKHVTEFMDKYESYNQFYEEYKMNIPENLEIQAYNKEQELAGNKRRRKLKEPFGVIFERAFKMILDDRIDILNNLKQIDFDIIMKNIPLNTNVEIIEKYRSVANLNLQKLKKDLNAINIDVNSFTFACSDIINREYGIHLLEGMYNNDQNTSQYFPNLNYEIPNIFEDLNKPQNANNTNSNGNKNSIYNFNDTLF